MKKYKIILLFTLVIVGGVTLIGCAKDKVPPPPEPTKWEKIAGDYKVYDTLGAYLYDMTLVHSYSEITGNDFIRFENFDGEFTYTTKQEKFVNYEMYVYFNTNDTLFDSQGKRWKLSSAAWEGYNTWENDTIKMRFQKTNINYYIEDATPYFYCLCKQIAVKQ